jgi:GAF domain-containing protein
MRFRERTIGMIALDSKELGYFTADHARLATAFASQATVAVENARLFEQEQARAERERLVRTITDKVRRSPDTEAIMRTTLQELGQMLGASRAIMRLGTQAQLCPDPGEGLPSSQEKPARRTKEI